MDHIKLKNILNFQEKIVVNKQNRSKNPKDFFAPRTRKQQFILTKKGKII